MKSRFFSHKIKINYFLCRALTSNNWDFIETLEKYEELLADGQVSEDNYLFPADEIQLPFLEQNEAGPSGFLPNPSVPAAPSTIPPPQPMQQIKVDLEANEEVPVPLTTLPQPRKVIKKERGKEGDDVEANEEIPVPLTSLPQPKKVIKKERKGDDVPKPKIKVKVEQFPDIKPTFSVKTENTRSESGRRTPVKAKSSNLNSNLSKSPISVSPKPSLTIRNDMLPDTKPNILRNDILPDLGSSDQIPTSPAVTIRNDLMGSLPLVKSEIIKDKIQTPDNEDDISTDEEPEYMRNVPVTATYVDDFYMENVPNLPKPGIIKSEVLRDDHGSQPERINLESSEPSLKRIKVEKNMKFERMEWPIPLNDDVKKEV